jgi:multiple sugar transport system permease protein
VARGERWTPYLFLLPAMALLLLWRYLPIASGLRESFYSNSLSFTGAREFVGWDNFRRLFDDPVFWNAMRVTAVFNLIVNPLQVALALALAVLANQKLRGIGLFRTVLLLPVAISINVTAIAWGLALDTNYGLVNGVLEALGLPAQPFLRSAEQALPTMIAIVSWIGVPYWALFLLAGLQAIPQEVLEAARVDGASRWRAFWQITFPLLRRVLAFVLVADSVVNLTLFAPPYLLTRGGPRETTNLAMYEAWQRGFVYGDLGASSAMVLVLLAITVAVVAIEFALLRPSH